VLTGLCPQEVRVAFAPARGVRLAFLELRVAQAREIYFIPISTSGDSSIENATMVEVPSCSGLQCIKYNTKGDPNFEENIKGLRITVTGTYEPFVTLFQIALFGVAQ